MSEWDRSVRCDKNGNEAGAGLWVKYVAVPFPLPKYYQQKLKEAKGNMVMHNAIEGLMREELGIPVLREML